MKLHQYACNLCSGRILEADNLAQTLHGVCLKFNFAYTGKPRFEQIELADKADAHLCLECAMFLKLLPIAPHTSACP